LGSGAFLQVPAAVDNDAAGGAVLGLQQKQNGIDQLRAWLECQQAFFRV
jgi:hypothetical protein